MPFAHVRESDKEDDLFTSIRERTREQGRGHWLEFAVILSSANVLTALVLIGRLAERREWDALEWSSVVVGSASVVAVMLAYYSVQVGTIVDFGPVEVPDVALSFVIAGAQLALFAIPVHVLGAGDGDIGQMRHWLLAYAIFALAASTANWRGAQTRVRNGLATRLAKFHRRQLIDRRVAATAGGAAFVAWVGSAVSPEVPLFVGGVAAFVLSCAGIVSHWGAGGRTLSEIELADVSTSNTSTARG